MSYWDVNSVVSLARIVVIVSEWVYIGAIKCKWVIECDCWCDTEEDDDDDESVGVDRSCSKRVCMYVDYIVICYYFVEIVMMSKMIMMI